MKTQNYIQIYVLFFANLKGMDIAFINVGWDGGCFIRTLVIVFSVFISENQTDWRLTVK